MLSNKLTFSLALILMFAFVVLPTFAQTMPVGDQTATPPTPATGGWIILETASDTNGIGAGATVDGTNTIPTAVDLADLLSNGGSIELSILQQAAADTAGSFSVAHDATDADIEALKHAVIISEIMWGYDRPGGTNAAVTTGQWIEVYNHAGLMANDALMLHFSTTKQAREPGTAFEYDPTPADITNNDEVMRVILDQVSTVDRFGMAWSAIPGNSGDTDGIAADGIAPMSLVSMYRKINLVDGKAEYKKNDDDDLDGLGDGTSSGSWAASVGRNANLSGNRVGSPGGVHVGTGGTVKTFAKTPSSIAGVGVVINEVRNDTSEANLDWVEFFNNADPTAADATPTNIENWTLSMVFGVEDADGNVTPDEANLFSLPKYKFQPGQYLVVYNRHPGETVLAGGVNIEDVAAGEQVNKGASHMYVVREGLNLPDDLTFTLILRNGNDKVKTHEKIVDYAGNRFLSEVSATKNTDFWPLTAWAAPGDVEGFGSITFAGQSSWGRVTDLNDKGVYWPKGRADNRTHKDDWADFGFIGAGYDRDVDRNAAPGTPGYANVAVNVVANDRDTADGKDDYVFGGTVTISEVMYDAGPRWNLVQWIELYNSSMTETINLDGWTMEIRNKEDVESYVDSSFDFIPHTKLLPNQTLLLVSGTGANDVDNTRVYNLYQHHRQDLGLLARDSVLLSRTGFYLKLTAKTLEGGEDETVVMDEVGNVVVDGATRTVAWELPARDPAARQSLVRQYGMRAIDGTPDTADDGTMAESWRQSDIAGAGLAYYGHRNDVGTPGYRLGGPLPVSLATFRPVRDKATGHVNITWVTESELNNAGFNILRSETKTGEFKVINLQGMIAGHGTTSEKHVYSYIDKTAKPNVVYYYQIEDVSLNGNRTTLRTTHLRGNVSAGGKLTTRWGELKSSGK